MCIAIVDEKGVQNVRKIGGKSEESPRNAVCKTLWITCGERVDNSRKYAETGSTGRTTQVIENGSSYTRFCVLVREDHNILWSALDIIKTEAYVVAHYRQFGDVREDNEGFEAIVASRYYAWAQPISLSPDSGLPGHREGQFAGSADQIATRPLDASLSLFSRFFLTALDGTNRRCQ
jgi:hypothetical protein